MRHCTSCGYELKDELICPACGAHITDDADKAKGSKGNAKDIEVANISVFLKYADLLDNEALYKAAICKLNGISVERNVKEAMEMLRILAFRGHLEAMYKYAECLLNDNPPDKDAACKWLTMAASEGHRPSRTLLDTLGYDVSKIAPQGRIRQVSGLESLVVEALPSIVTIEAGTTSNGQNMRSMGSGFILEGGYVITNAHVIGNNPTYITARFEPDLNQTAYNLMPLAIAPTLDIAVLRFTGLADSKFSAQKNLSMRLEDLAYGEDVYTIGNPLGIGLSVSKGVISCPNRASNYPPAVGEVIQTDITANHGNSGGALLDMSNNVLGMITFAPVQSEGGMAMCVPACCIVAVLNKINQISKRGK